MRQQHRFAIVAVLVWGTLLGAGALKPGFVHADTVVIPTASISGRYDTNIFFAPPSRLPAGTRTDDFVSTVGGGAQVLHRSREVDAKIAGGVDFNVFAYNSGVNFVTTRLEGTANLDGWVNQFVRGAQLRVNERFRYTPESPGFFTGGAAGAEDPFLRGIQGFRANTFLNTTSVDGSYPLDSTLSLQGSYSFSTRRVGSALAATGTGATFFDTDVHTWQAGPRWQVTPIDNIALLSQQSLISQSRSSGTTGTFETLTQTLSVNYNRVMPDWTFSVVGGATLIEPSSRAYPTGSIRFSTHPERATTINLDLSRVTAPSIFLLGGAFISNVGRVQLVHRLSERLSLRGSANYAFNETIPSRAKFNNLTLSTGLSYNLTRSMVVDLFYDHLDFKTDSAALDFTILRDVVGVSLTAQWE
jgi:opacity protein-like surface antigen